MLSPDKLVANPKNGQNYNRYSYVLNNPLKYTDPSGWVQQSVVGSALDGGGMDHWAMAGFNLYYNDGIFGNLSDIPEYGNRGGAGGSGGSYEGGNGAGANYSNYTDYVTKRFENVSLSNTRRYRIRSTKFDNRKQVSVGGKVLLDYSVGKSTEYSLERVYDSPGDKLGLAQSGGNGIYSYDDYLAVKSSGVPLAIPSVYNLSSESIFLKPENSEIALKLPPNSVYISGRWGFVKTIWCLQNGGFYVCYYR